MDRNNQNMPTEEARSKRVVTPDAAVEHNCFLCSRPDSAANLVGCDKCENWAHYDCAGVSSSIEATEKSWVCAACLSNTVEVASKAASRSSRRSSRIQENIQMLEEEKDMELKALEKEEEDRKEFRKKRLEIEKEFLKQKYDVQREGSRGNRSEQSKASSRNSRQIVENWLAKEPVGAQPERVAAWEFPPQSSNTEPFVSVARAISSISLSSPPNVPLVPKSASTPYAGQGLPLLTPVVLPDIRMPQLTVVSPTGSRLVPRVSVPETFSQKLPSALPLAEPNRTAMDRPEDLGNRLLVPSSFCISPDSSAMRCFVNSLCDRRPLSTISEETIGHNLSVPLSNFQQQPIAPMSANESVKITTGPNSGPPFAYSVVPNCTDMTLVQGSVRLSEGVPHPYASAMNNSPNVTWVVDPLSSVPITTIASSSLPIGHEGLSPPSTMSPFLQNTRVLPAKPVEVPLQTRLNYRPPPVIPREDYTGPSNKQLAARQVIQRELPDFSGHPQDWPLFFWSFKNSSDSCGFTNEENLARLQRCLKGQALDAVKSKLQFPAAVPEIIETLKMLFGQPEILLYTMLQQLRGLPPPKHENLQSIITFGLAVKNAVDYLTTAQLREHLFDSSLLIELVEKLPTQLQIDWSRFKRKNSVVNLETFSTFMTELVVVTADVVLPKKAALNPEKSGKSVREKQKIYVHVEDHESEEPSDSEQVPRKLCVYCSNPSHEVANCSQFKALDVEGRCKVIKQKGMCRNCLVPHRRWPCRSTKECRVEGCRVRHHSLLHSNATSSPSNHNVKNQVNRETAYHNHHAVTSYALFRYLPVEIHCGGEKIETYAFLDDGSSATMIESWIPDKLGITGRVDPLWLSWTGDISREEKKSQRISVLISAQGSDKMFKMEDVRTVPQLKLPEQSFDYETIQKEYPHLKGLPLQSYSSATPGIIIGIDQVRLLAPLATREGRNNELVAVKTRLGWSVYGKQLSTADCVEHLHVHVDQQTSNQELHGLVGQFFGLEESLVVKRFDKSVEKGALRTLEETTRRIGNRFETGLLWKYQYRSFPNSYATAVRREISLHKKLEKDPQLYKVVREQIKNYLDQGYAHKITDQELAETQPEQVWYLPLGVVRNPKKPEKIRLVWDAAAKSYGVSLNDMLSKGPDMLASLTAILLRFREKNIAICGDVKEMFHQVNIRKEDRQAQRFLFRDQPDQPPQVYVMDVATFGASCSPCIAQYIKNLNAHEHAEQYPLAAEAIVERTYVDDYLDSLDTPEEAVTRINEVRYVHSLGGFEIRNFVSNSTEVLKKIGAASVQKNISLKFEPGVEESNQVERILGMMWRPHSDTFTFNTIMQPAIERILNSSRAPTKRQILSTVMSLFDPLGLVAHFVVHGKILMQELWKYGAEWDDVIPDELIEVWNRWRNLLPRLNEVSVPRCFFPGMVISALDGLQLHVLVDASESAFACVAYLRILKSDNPTCALVAAKTKVAPLKPISMPRSELQAALMGARLIESVSETLKLPIGRRYLWTDSLTVLSWLRSDSRRYHQFVAFRVGEILTKTTISEWRYVPSKLNVAFDATKWGNGPSFCPSDRWFTGPEFLQQPENLWPADRKTNSQPEEELRAAFLHHNELPNTLIEITRYSRWERLIRATSCFLRVAQRFKKVVITGPYTSEEMQRAETFLIIQVQTEVYPAEYRLLKKNIKNAETVSISKLSVLYPLSPFMDEFGVIRMDSRIGVAPHPLVENKYPIILPKNHHFTDLLIYHYHQRFFHRNNETVCNEIHQRYRIQNLRVSVRRVAKSCKLCQIRNARPRPPRMAPLPTARLTPYIKPFTHTGVDFFGPLMVKQGRSLVKRWVSLFTCLTIRAVHVEIVHSLSASSCILAIRRFIARRGSPSSFYSDNGTNFRGAYNILRHQIQNINEECAITFTNTNTQWHFNPPLTPHMGGCWERMVRSIKEAMQAVGEHVQNPSDEILETVVLEAESIVNSRPLTYVPLDNFDSEALTPNLFLMYSEKGITQPARLIQTDTRVLRDSWRLAQTLVDLFWSRWIKEYLPSIARRTKWFDAVKPLEEGDVVIVINENRRNGWERGRILEVVKAADGQVRQVVIQTATGVCRRPATKVALLDVRQE
ncbi:uncharacterized protein LOC129742271 [Uranotaenia lowii]|uniref:uncharacterized protein LOC129742271 n=1 Tax=Uranotaenia lowii TaxID=190385 RepID=UPI00247A3390|nr:uncharacterized protein LOC129742271 [Uranotaenia lowii]